MYSYRTSPRLPVGPRYNLTNKIENPRTTQENATKGQYLTMSRMQPYSKMSKTPNVERKPDCVRDLRLSWTTTVSLGNLQTRKFKAPARCIPKYHLAVMCFGHGQPTSHNKSYPRATTHCYYPSDNHQLNWHTRRSEALPQELWPLVSSGGMCLRNTTTGGKPAPELNNTSWHCRHKGRHPDRSQRGLFALASPSRMK